MVGLAVDLSRAQQLVLIELYRATLVCQATVCIYRLCCRFLSRLCSRRIKNAHLLHRCLFRRLPWFTRQNDLDMVWNFRQTYASHMCVRGAVEADQTRTSDIWHIALPYDNARS